jgi:hypothetical protein
MSMKFNMDADDPEPETPRPFRPGPDRYKGGTTLSPIPNLEPNSKPATPSEPPPSQPVESPTTPPPDEKPGQGEE